MEMTRLSYVLYFFNKIMQFFDDDDDDDDTVFSTFWIPYSFKDNSKAAWPWMNLLLELRPAFL